MTKQDSDALDIDRDLVLDRIYEIALEPSSLEDFIDFWHDSELATQFKSTEGRNPGEFDKSYKAHLERAQKILQRGETTRPDMKEYLQPYDNLAAFVVSGSLHVEACNQGALSAFGVKPGDSLDQLALPLEMREALTRTTQEVLRRSKHPEKLLKAEMATKSGTILFALCD